MQSATVRVSPETRETLRWLSRETGKSMQAILDKAIETYRRQHFLETANAAFAALRENAEAWQAEQEDRAAWDVTSADGLEEG